MTALRKSPQTPASKYGVQTEIRLLDWFETDNDPGGVIARMVLALDQLAARRGVRLYPQTSYEALRATVDDFRGQGANLSPNMDVAFSDVSDENAIWILGIDADGMPVTTQGGRYFDWTGTSMAAEMESFRFFYQEPERHVTGDMYCRIPRPEGDMITGPVMHSGSIWVRPDFRGPGEEGIVLSKVLGRLTRMIGMARWQPDYLFTFSSLDLYGRGVVKNFGWPHEAFQAEWHLPTFPHFRAGLFWMTREEMMDWARGELPRLLNAA